MISPEQPASSAAKPRTTMNGKPVFSVEVKTVLSMKSGFEKKLLCDGPVMAFGDACAYGCSFCYVPSVYRKLDRVDALLTSTGLKHEDMVIRRKNALAILRGQLIHENGKRRFPDPTDRRVVYTSPADDVAANMDLVRETADAVALILEHTHWQVRLLSKSNLLPKVAALMIANRGTKYTERDVMERTIWGFSTGTLQDEVAQAIEEGTPRVSKRIQALHKMQDEGFRTYLMICPSLPDPFGGYKTWAETCAQVLRAERSEHVWAEVINLRGESFARTFARLIKCGLDGHAKAILRVSQNKEEWDAYNRATFEAHSWVYSGSVGKLRYLTYTTPENIKYWNGQVQNGAVLL